MASLTSGLALFPVPCMGVPLRSFDTVTATSKAPERLPDCA
ncbi:MAG TPA: hypothetical protein VJ577_11260 [Burkholderiaceae bacterium]|nr:hypothetical protein [Burkholderiaceae bacterium]